MFSKLAIFSTFVILAAAQCNNAGDGAFCCNTVGAANVLPGAQTILGLLGIVLDPITTVVGLGCLPIVGGACSTTAVCCTNNAFSPLINIGCNTIVL